MTESRAQSLLAYGVAGLIGLAAMLAMLPISTLTGTGGLWRATAGDPAVALTAHFAFQVPGWHWPLLRAPDLVWPAGRSIAMADGNPLASLIAKLLAALAGHRVNLLGAWIGLCWALQPVAAVYALRSANVHRDRQAPWEAILAAGLLALMCPAWLMRFRHVNLLGHFLLLVALGLAMRASLRRAPVPWWTGCGLLIVAILVHPYLFAFCAAMLGAPTLRALLVKPRPRGRWLVCQAGMVALPVGLIWLLSASLGNPARGFGHYSMNLVSPMWPQLSGLFGAGLPIVDATGGQYEGFNYAGGGVLLLIAAAGWCLLRRPVTDPAWRAAAPALLAVLGALTLLALTPHIYMWQWRVVDLPEQPWRSLFGALQASGRAFWIVGYALMLGAIALLAQRLRRAVLIPLLICAVVLQAIDTGPVRGRARAYLAGDGQAAPPFAMPPGARLLRIVPACDPVTAPADLLRLNAVRAGLRLADMRMARQPAGYDCETALSDGLDSPLQWGELRLFLPAARDAVRSGAFGPGVTCTRLDLNVLCSRGVEQLAADPAAAAGRAVPTLSSQPAKVQGDALSPLVSFGWHRDASGAFWSEGPRATLLFAAPSGTTTGLVVELEMDGIAQLAGGRRGVTLGIDDRETAVDLADLERTSVVLALPPHPAGLPYRVSLDVRRPIDPVTRNLAAPVSRAALRLFAIGWRRPA